MKISDITIGMVGSGGDGVAVAGDILISSAAGEGIHGLMMKSFGPQIRGGESSCRVRISKDKIYSQGSGLDVLVCFNWSDYVKFSGELNVKENVIIIVDEDDPLPEKDFPITSARNRKVIKIPFMNISRDINNPKGKNMVMLGVLSQLFHFFRNGIISSITRKFEGKTEEIVQKNLESFRAGEEYARQHLKDFDIKFSYKKHEPFMLLTGDEAVALGALVAGCKFYASYPITPATEIMEWLASELPKFGGTTVQAEDEISAICMVTGAAYGGLKAMTATSGPGLSLKLEAIGLGTMAEIPYVVVDVQRGGPSTGLPTKPEQADLCQAVYGMHGDAPHAVLAAADVEDCFRVTIEAFNIAEAYQMPVILLSDQFLGHRKETVRELNFEDIKLTERRIPRRLSPGGYKRFTDTPDGVSPMTYPGMKCGEYLCSGIEHDEWGAPSAKHSVHEKMSIKRQKKVDKLEKEFKFKRRYGHKNPEVAVITWGSNKGVTREAVEFFADKEGRVGAIVPELLYPLQKNIFKNFLKGAKALVVVENSFNGQFLRYLKSYLDLPKKVFHLKASGGRFFSVGDVIREIDKAIEYCR